MGKRGPKLGPGGHKLTAKGYVRVWHAPSGRLRMQHDIVWEAVHGPIPDGCDVHHKDEVRTHNVIENLELLPRLDHKRLHGGCTRDADGQWLKPCRKCQVVKPVETGFYKRADGISSRCKACSIAAAVLTKQLKTKAMNSNLETQP